MKTLKNCDSVDAKPTQEPKKESEGGKSDTGSKEALPFFQCSDLTLYRIQCSKPMQYPAGHKNWQILRPNKC